MLIADHLFFDPRMKEIQRRKLRRWSRSMDEPIHDDFLLIILRMDSNNFVELVPLQEIRLRFLENNAVLLLGMVNDLQCFERYLCTQIKLLLDLGKEIRKEDLLQLIEEIDYESTTFRNLYHS